jgi:hypothetical protein
VLHSVWLPLHSPTKFAIPSLRHCRIQPSQLRMSGAFSGNYLPGGSLRTGMARKVLSLPDSQLARSATRSGVHSLPANVRKGGSNNAASN